MAELPCVRVEEHFVRIESIAKSIVVGEEARIAVASFPGGIKNPIRPPTTKTIERSMRNVFQASAPNIVTGVLLKKVAEGSGLTDWLFENFEKNLRCAPRVNGKSDLAVLPLYPKRRALGRPRLGFERAERAVCWILLYDVDHVDPGYLTLRCSVDQLL